MIREPYPNNDIDTRDSNIIERKQKEEIPEYKQEIPKPKIQRQLQWQTPNFFSPEIPAYEHLRKLDFSRINAALDQSR